MFQSLSLTSHSRQEDFYLLVGFSLLLLVEMKLKAKKDALAGRLWQFPLSRMASSVLNNCILAVLLTLCFRKLKTIIFSFLFPLVCSSGPPPRLQLAQHSGVGGLCAFLRGDGGPLLPLHGRSRAWRRVRLLPDPAQSLFFLLLLALPLLFILSARGLSQGRHLQELEEVPGGVHGDSDVHGLHPGEGAAQTGPQRCWRLIPSAVTAALKCNWSHSSYIFYTRSLNHLLSSGLFEVRAQEYLDSLPGSEQRGVNKFLKGLGETHCLCFCILVVKHFVTLLWEVTYK